GRVQKGVPGRSMIDVRTADCLIDLMRDTIASTRLPFVLLFIPTKPIASAIDNRSAFASSASLGRSPSIDSKETPAEEAVSWRFLTSTRSAEMSGPGFAGGLLREPGFGETTGTIPVREYSTARARNVPNSARLWSRKGWSASAILESSAADFFA